MSAAPRIVRALAGLLIALIIAAAVMIWAIDTPFGRRLIVNQLNGFAFSSGLAIKAKRIDGSIYGTLSLHDVTLHDPRGVFATAPQATIDWRPLAYLHNRIDVRRVHAPRLRLLRAPALRPGDPDAPILPDIDIAIAAIALDDIVIAPPIAGTERHARLAGTIIITGGRVAVRGIANSRDGGDRIALRLDAVPAADRFDLSGRVDAPARGLVAQASGLRRDLRAAISGQGSWQQWAGVAKASAGGIPIADVTLTARSGVFRLNGTLTPAALLAGAVERLTTGGVRIAAQGRLAARTLSIAGAARTPALAVKASGTIDLARSTMSAGKLDAQLITPGTIANGLVGDGIALTLAATGRIAAPVIDYQLSANRIGFGTTVVRGLSARGTARMAASRSARTATIPITASAQAVEGLSASVGDVLRDVSVAGTFVRTGNTVLADDLAVRSRSLAATALVVADVGAGLYRGAINGRVSDYQITGVGAIDLTSDIRIEPARGGYGLGGRVAIETRRIDNASLRQALGGPMIARARIGYAPSGVFSLSDVRGRAPGLSITSGGGTIAHSGAIDLSAVGTSRSYGPLSASVSGTLARQVIRVRAPRPRLGIQFSDVDALITRSATGYAITASGGSAYGPVRAEVTVLSGAGPLTIDIARARFSNIDVAGRIRQTPSGPFEGALSANGEGLTGKIDLTNAAGVQRAAGEARAVNARIDGADPITIDQALISGDAVLYDDAPQLRLDAQAVGVRQGDTAVAQARLRIAYRGGRGSAQLIANGARGRPFALAVNARLSPGLTRAAISARYGGIALRTQQPAIIREANGDYTLDPVMITTAQGNLRIAGRYGETLALSAEAERLDLAIINLIMPSAAIGGSLSGTLSFAQTGAATPTIDARLSIAQFTRAGAFTLANPVDIRGLGQLGPGGGRVDAIINRGGRAIGRISARTAAGSATIATAPLSGGIRYNGPAETLWSLTGRGDQQLSGAIGIAADLGGTLERPQLSGLVRANALTYDNDTYGTRVTGLMIDGRFSNETLEIARFAGRAGSGTISGSGRINLAANQEFPYRVTARLAQAQLARSDTLGSSVSGDVVIAHDAGKQATISGDLSLGETRYVFARQGAADVVDLAGVRRKGAAIVTEAGQRAASATKPGLFALDLRLRADRRVQVEGLGLEAEWATDLRVTGTSTAPAITGDVTLVRGTYGFAGRRFDLDQSSRILFRGGPVTDPQLAISARTSVNGVTATITISGTAQRPQIMFGSIPTLPQDEVLSRLLFGGSVTQLSATQTLQLAASLNALRGAGGGVGPLGRLRAATGLNRLRVLGADQATGRGTALAAGRYIGNDIFVEIITDTRGFTVTQLEISLSRALSVLSQIGGTGNTNASIRYSRDY